MAWKVKTEPTVEPVSLAELKEHLKVSYSAEDTLITSLGVAARRYIEKLTDKVLVTQVIEEYFDSFPVLTGQINLCVEPIQTVDSIKYIASDTTDLTLTTWADTKYRADLISSPSRIAPRRSEYFPSTQLELNSIVVEYTAGFGLAADVPDIFKTAIKLLVAELYENRENRVRQLPTTVLALLKLEMDFSLL